MISPDIALHRGAFKLVYLVCLGIVKAQHNVVSLAILVRHQEAVDDCSNGQNVCLHAVLVAQHHRRVGVFLLCLRSSNMKKTKKGYDLSMKIRELVRLECIDAFIVTCFKTIVRTPAVRNRVGRLTLTQLA